ncbi:hypothetical protein [Streptomyces roseochromogenus]|uniref:hypothetical protein n=1 Tax=Streptomyces roseochromogenus TaxID=285450 RepID=UPI000A83DBF9|nr:hypothetical protein [Streptomyces roseochromogenus]
MSGSPFFQHDFNPDSQPHENPSPGGAQRAVRGRVLVSAGWTLRIVGTASGFLGFTLFRQSVESDQWSSVPHVRWWLRLLGAVAVFFAGVAVFMIGRQTVVRGKQHIADVIESLDRLPGTRYLLYLRPFSHDALMSGLPDDIQGGGNAQNFFLVSGLTYEESLVRRFRRFGRVIAIGQPDEALPLPGAARGYLPLNDWQSQVSRLIAGAHAVLLAAGPGPGTVWEFTEAVRLVPPTRLLLLAYCDAPTYDRFREAVAEEYDRRSHTEPGAPATGLWPPLPGLPDYPPPARPERPRWEVLLNGGKKRLRWDFTLKGLIVFRPDWAAKFIRFDPTTLRLSSTWTLSRLVRRELQPVMDQLTALDTREEPGDDAP